MEGRVDGICACSYSSSRDDKLIYSDPLGESATGLFYKTSSGPAPTKSLDALSNRKVGVVRSYNLQQELIDHNVIPTLVNDEDSGIRLLIHDRFEFFYSFKAPALFALANQNEKRNIEFIKITTAPYFACFNKFVPDVANIIKNLNKGMSEIRADGTYAKILEKYR